MRSFLSVIACAITLFVVTSSCCAMEALNFSDKMSERHAFLISQFTKLEREEFLVAYIDLNNDKVDEIIVRDIGCFDGELCTYYLLAEEENFSLVEVSQFKAKNMLIDDRKTANIRDILIVDDHVSDFNYSRYSWDIEKSRYEKNKM